MRIISLIAVLGSTASALTAQSFLFWGQNQNDIVQRSNLDGTNASALTPTLGNPWGLDVNDSTVYFTEDQVDKVWKMDLDGSNRTEITSAINLPRDIMAANGSLYVVADFTTIYRLNPDGTGLTSLFTGGSFLQGVYVSDTFIYSTDSNADKIRRTDLNGGNVTDLVTSGLNIAYGVFATQNHLYWTDIGDDTIMRSNLDGTSATTLISTLVNPTGLFIDDSSIYFTQQAESSGGVGGVYRANLDGTDVTALVTGLKDVRFLDAHISAIPEPSSFALLTGLATLTFIAPRRRR